MSERLQVVFDDAEFEELRSAAESRGTTVSEWVRHALRQARRGDASGDVETRLSVVRTAAQHAFPVGDIGDMLADIERGYLER